MLLEKRRVSTQKRPAKETIAVLTIDVNLTQLTHNWVIMLHLSAAMETGRLWGGLSCNNTLSVQIAPTLSDDSRKSYFDIISLDSSYHNGPPFGAKSLSSRIANLTMSRLLGSCKTFHSAHSKFILKQVQVAASDQTVTTKCLQLVSQRKLAKYKSYPALVLE